MNAVLLLLPVTVLVAGVFVVLFVRAVKDGQYDDLDDPPQRMLRD
jgi:cbb3-type cytochrome oxidase maturation protein